MSGVTPTTADLEGQAGIIIGDFPLVPEHIPVEIDALDVHGKRVVPVPSTAVAAPPARKLIEYSYDPITDIFVIEGTKFSGDFFRNLRTPPRGLLFRVTRKEEDGTVYMHIYRRGQQVYA